MKGAHREHLSRMNAVLRSFMETQEATPATVIRLFLQAPAQRPCAVTSAPFWGRKANRGLSSEIIVYVCYVFTLKPPWENKKTEITARI
jgi:hypothetical protein